MIRCGSGRALDPVRQIVGIGIAGIQEAAGLHHQPHGVDGGTAGVPAERALAGGLGVDADRLGDLRAAPRPPSCPCARSISGCGWRYPSPPPSSPRPLPDCASARWRRRTPWSAVLRSVNIRHSRQKPAREPYSNIDSILAWRWPGQGCAPSTSDRNASEARSPCRILFSPPSSKFTTNCTATRALPGQRGSGGLRP